MIPPDRFRWQNHRSETKTAVLHAVSPRQVSTLTAVCGKVDPGGAEFLPAERGHTARGFRQPLCSVRRSCGLLNVCGRFQSSPNPKVRCNEFGTGEVSEISIVSPPTRPVGRVRYPIGEVPYVFFPFQSSPDQKAGCDYHRGDNPPPDVGVSIPTRPVGRVRRSARRSPPGAPRRFNPSRPEDRVRHALPPRRGRARPVSILTPPGGRVRPVRLGADDDGTRFSIAPPVRATALQH